MIVTDLAIWFGTLGIIALIGGVVEWKEMRKTR